MQDTKSQLDLCQSNCRTRCRLQQNWISNFWKEKSTIVLLCCTIRDIISGSGDSWHADFESHENVEEKYPCTLVDDQGKNIRIGHFPAPVHGTSSPCDLPARPKLWPPIVLQLTSASHFFFISIWNAMKEEPWLHSFRETHVCLQKSRRKALLNRSIVSLVSLTSCLPLTYCLQ